ncbi:MAG: histidine phosphatase family protein [Nitrosomonas sp.]|nr:histidine phosphatase family protein [Nitrosomonas sp.]
MPHQLYLLRHAKSDWKQGVISDLDRPLSKRGQADAPRMAAWLARQDNIPTVMISSPALRAYQTAMIFAEALNIPAKNIQVDSRIYAASPETLLEVVRTLPEQAQSVLLVGHNPGLDCLLQILCRETKPGIDGKLMTTCAVAEITVDGRWQDITDQQCRLCSVSRPKEIA